MCGGARRPVWESEAPVGLYKILFHFEAFVHESIILLLPPPRLHLHCPHGCNTIAILLLRNIRTPSDPPYLYAIYTIQYCA